ncbi:MAG: uroporphyrinogen-III synthase [Mucispirillum sp.]|nr:uroporphyrinogen-III synthase [Mucispirillum sp.]
MRTKNRRVLVTRQFEQSGSFINALSAKGHYPFILPMIETVQLCPDIEEGVYEIIFFTSANAVKYFAPYHSRTRGIAYIALGSKTAQAMEVFLGVSADRIPVVYDLDNVMKIIYSIPLKGARILSPGALKRTELPFEELEEMGASVLVPAVYETAFASYPAGYVDKFIADNKIDVVTFCSPSAAKSFFLQYKGDNSAFEIVSIGKTTALYLSEHDIVSRFPDEFTVESMAQII